MAALTRGSRGRRAAHQVLARLGQRWCELDAGGVGRGHGDDDAVGGEDLGCGHDAHAFGSLVLDPKNGPSSRTRSPRPGRHPLRDHLRAAVDTLVLGASVVEDHRQETSGGAQIVKDPEQRDALGVAGPGRTADQQKHEGVKLVAACWRSQSPRVIWSSAEASFMRQGSPSGIFLQSRSSFQATLPKSAACERLTSGKNPRDQAFDVVSRCRPRSTDRRRRSRAHRSGRRWRSGPVRSTRRRPRRRARCRSAC